MNGDKAGAVWNVRVGIPWSGEEFAHQAVQVGHFFGRSADVPEEVAIAIENIVTREPSATRKKMTVVIRDLKYRAKRIKNQEAKLRTIMHHDVERVLRGKHGSLLQTFLKDTGYPDTELFSDLIAGFPRIGK